MRLDNSEICILLKNFTKTKACDPGGYAAAAVEIIVHQGRSVVDTLVAIQRSINSDQIRSIQMLINQSNAAKIQPSFLLIAQIGVDTDFGR